MTHEALTVEAAPATEPLTVAEVRSHLRLDSSAGEVAPTAPTAALAGDGAGNVDDGVHRYRVTFVTADGETEGGTISDALTVADKTSDGKISLTAIPLGGSAVTSRKVYRTEADASDYKLLTTIADNTTTTYTDNIADASLGVACPTTNTTEDPTVNALITVARQYAETVTRRALITQTWNYTLDAFPDGDIEVPLPTLQSVTHIKYYDTNGVQQTWTNTNYSVDTDSEPGRISCAYGVTYPTTREMNNAVEVQFVAGYGVASAVPQGIKQAMLQLIGHWYAHRETVAVLSGFNIQTVPQTAEMLFWPYRVLTTW